MTIFRFSTRRSVVSLREERGEIIEIRFGGRAKDDWQREDSSFTTSRLQPASTSTATPRVRLPLAPSGLPFQRSVWSVLRRFRTAHVGSYLTLRMDRKAVSVPPRSGAANGAIRADSSSLSSVTARMDR